MQKNLILYKVEGCISLIELPKYASFVSRCKKGRKGADSGTNREAGCFRREWEKRRYALTGKKNLPEN